MNGKLLEMKSVYGLSDKEDNLCLVCLTEKKNMILKPCYHMCVCEFCSVTMVNSLHKCPICRSAISETEKIDIIQ